MADVHFTSAYELARQIRAREVSPVEVVEACLARIEQINPVLNAFVALRENEARAEAKALAERLAHGENIGPLGGLPVGIKDLDDVQGLPTTYGSVPFKDNLPRGDSVHVARLRQAGAIIVGKTNTPEFGYAAFTKNLVFGITRNPWDPQRTPGGSSGGSAAAVASGMVPLATGTDRGGSIRIPASYTGCFGLKPSFGRVPRGPFPMLTWSDTEVYGPITRTVRDAALYLDVAAGPHPCDPDSLPSPAASYLEALERLPRKLRVAWTPTLGYARCDPQVLREARGASRVFEKLGHDVEECSMRRADPGPHWRAIGAAERYAELAGVIEPHRSEFGRGFLAGVEAGRDVTPKIYGAAQRARAALNSDLAELFARYDLLLTPTTPTVAFDARGRLPEEIDGRRVGDPLEVVAFTYPFNLSGHPAATVRAGFTDDGLSVGLQIVAPRHRDDLVLQAAHAYEQKRPWNDSWPDEIAAAPLSD